MGRRRPPRTRDTRRRGASSSSRDLRARSRSVAIGIHAVAAVSPIPKADRQVQKRGTSEIRCQREIGFSGLVIQQQRNITHS
jgi:hypothetical protein